MQNDSREYVGQVAPAALVLEPDAYDAACVGVVEKINMEPVACYDFEKLIAAAMSLGIETRQEAIEYIDFNVAGSLGAEMSPVILYRP